MPSWVSDFLNSQITGLGIAGLVVVAFIRGWLVSSRWLERMLEIHAARVAEALTREREWRDIAELHRRTADVAVRQAAELLEISRTSNSAIAALRQVMEKEPEVA